MSASTSASTKVAHALRARVAAGLSLGPFTGVLLTDRGRINARGHLAMLHSTTECSEHMSEPAPALDVVVSVALCPACAPVTSTAVPRTSFEREALARGAWWQVLESYGEAVVAQLRLARAEASLPVARAPDEAAIIRFARLGVCLGAPGSVGHWHRNGLWFTRYTPAVFAASFAGLYDSARLGAAQVLTEANELLAELDIRFETLRRRWPTSPATDPPGDTSPVWAVYRPRDLSIDHHFADQLEVTWDGPALAVAMAALAAAEVVATRDRLTLLATTRHAVRAVEEGLGPTLAVCPRPGTASGEVAATVLAALDAKPSNRELGALVLAASTAVS